MCTTKYLRLNNKYIVGVINTIYVLHIYLKVHTSIMIVSRILKKSFDREVNIMHCSLHQFNMKEVVVGVAFAILLSVHLEPSQGFTFPSSHGIGVPRGLSKSPSYSSVHPRLFSTVPDNKKESDTATKKYDPSDDFTGESPSKLIGEKVRYSDLTVGVLKEKYPGENRVSIAPDSAKLLVDAGMSVIVEAGAGDNASFSDAAYVSVGCIVLPREQVYAQADILTKIRPPDELDVPLLSKKTIVSIISPGINGALYSELTKAKTDVFALDCVPRMLSRAQTYDVLSSQANIAGYRAIVEAANNFPRFFAGQMTAAGKVPPAKVLVLGVGVAGLAAIQTAKNM